MVVATISEEIAAFPNVVRIIILPTLRHLAPRLRQLVGQPVDLRQGREEIIQRLRGLDERAYPIGVIERRDPDDDPLIIDPGFLKAG